MNAEDSGNSKALNLLFKPAGMMMESRLRQWLMNPIKTLQGAGIKPGQTILEVGVRYRIFHYTGIKSDWRSRLSDSDGRIIRLY